MMDAIARVATLELFACRAATYCQLTSDLIQTHNRFWTIIIPEGADQFTPAMVYEPIVPVNRRDAGRWVWHLTKVGVPRGKLAVIPFDAGLIGEIDQELFDWFLDTLTC